VDIFNSYPEKCPSRIHMVLGWENILRVSSWKSTRPAASDAFILLRNSGIGSYELQPFKTSDVNDLLPWLYYGKRLDILRRICHTAKKQLENHLQSRIIRVDSHLIADDTKRIIASSL
jgi:hypothetical protein